MNNYRGNILESFYMIDIPTNPEELATLLDNYALDWGTTLSFLSSVARSRGMIIDVDTVSSIMKRKYGEVD